MTLSRRSVVLAVAAGLLAGCGSATAQGQGSAVRIPMAEFKQLHQKDAVVVLDIRDAGSYAAGHIPGALSVPEDAVPQHLAQLKALKKPIVTYCA